MTASSTTSAFPFSRSATIIMCFAKIRHRERLGERLEQEIAEVERRTDHDVAVVELPRDQPPAVSPVEQALAATLSDPVELSSQTAYVGEPHRFMLAGRG